MSAEVAGQVVVTRGSEAVRASDESAGSEASSLVRLAIDKGVDVAVIERLVGLKERVEDRSARAAFFDAVAAFQEECPEIPKSKKAKITTKKGGSYGYSYAPLDVIARVIRPYLAKHGLSYSFTASVAGQNALNITCRLRHIDGHAEEADFPVSIETDAAMSGAQKNGAALTYGRRMSLISVLGINTADPDTDGADPEKRPGDDAFITETQAAEIDALIDDVGANRAKFLEWLGVEKVSQIKKGDVQRATRALEDRRRA